MKSLKIDFCDLWRDFDKTNNYFWNLLNKRFNLEISENPDVIIYGPQGLKHRGYSCLKIFYTGENVRPNFWECDFAFSFDYLKTNRNYRLPLYALYDDPNKLARRPSLDDIVGSKTKFCNFIYSNAKARERMHFYSLLSKYKKIDSAGGVLNNTGYRVSNKREFIKPYKFTISFENESYPGYTTEKIFEPMLENSIPIYWGNPIVHKEFNPKSFINIHQFKSFEQAIEHIIQVDQDDGMYRTYLNEPFFNNNQVPECIMEGSILNRFESIFNQIGNMKPVSGTFRPGVAYFYKDAVNRLKNYKKKFEGLLSKSV